MTYKNEARKSVNSGSQKTQTWQSIITVISKASHPYKFCSHTINDYLLDVILILLAQN